MKLLEDLKILDFTTLLPGPFATWLLGEMGANVLKISAPNKPDMVLVSEPKTKSGMTANRAWLNNRKQEIFLDLKSEDGRNEVKRLLVEEGYNCIIEQFRPGVMDRLGLGYDVVKEISKDIIYLSLSGYGQDGPYRDKGGHDINYLSLAGVMSYSGRTDQGPVLYGMQIADVASAQNAVIGILAANNKRHLTGEGSYVDVSILDSVIPFNTMSGAGTMMNGINPARESDWLNGGSLYDFYETSDKQYMSVGSLEPKFFKALCEVMGHEDWIAKGCVCDDFVEKKEILRAEFKTKTRAEWEEIFSKVDACVEPVLMADEALINSENSKVRKSVKYIELNGEKILTYGNPIKFK